MTRIIEYTVAPEYDGMKLYTFLRSVNSLSLTAVRKLKHTDGGILRNGEFIRTVDTVAAGDVITVSLPVKPAAMEPTEIALDILYEDDDILVINKPATLAMHPTHNHQGDTLANAVVNYFEKKGRQTGFHAVGRLDKCTSGVVVCALNSVAAGKLSGKIEKEYYALVQGEYSGSGTVDKPIYRPDPGKTLRAAGETGDRAVTHWKALSSAGGVSLLSITLETGRTHQIRVHFSSLQTPLCGDEMYGGTTDLISRAALHCRKAEFTHPVTNEKMTFTAPLPEDMHSAASKAGIKTE